MMPSMKSRHDFDHASTVKSMVIYGVGLFDGTLVYVHIVFSGKLECLIGI